MSLANVLSVAFLLVFVGVIVWMSCTQERHLARCRRCHATFDSHIAANAHALSRECWR